MSKKISKDLYSDLCHNVNNDLTVILGYLTIKSSLNPEDKVIMVEKSQKIADYIRSMKELVEE